MADIIQIPEEILKSYDLFLQYRIVENITKSLSLDVTSTENRWSFECAIRIPFPNKSCLPECVKLEVVLLENYPYSAVQCYSTTEEIKGLPHQDSESGKLCLKEDRLAPCDERKLAVYVTWAKEWLTDAANGTLISSSDPYELPDFSRKLFRKTRALPISRIFLFNEDNFSFNIWKEHIGSYGKVKANHPGRMRSIFLAHFFNQSGLPIYSSNFAESLYDQKDDIWGYWIILETIYYKNFRPPQTYGEIRELFRNSGFEFDKLLKKVWDNNNRSKEIGFFLIGFPIPEYFYGEFVEIHWAPLTISNIRYARRFSKSKKSNKIWRSELKENYSFKNQLPWTPSLNISHSRMYKRGSLSHLLTKKIISVIGCGAIGGLVAQHFVRGGSLNINLYDSDILELVNLCRHTLDGEDMGYPKSLSLRDSLQSINPLANIKHFVNDVPISLEDNLENEALKASDLIVDCTANDNAFKWLNNFAVKNKNRLLTIYFNFHAEIITIILSGDKTNCYEIYSSLMNDIKVGKTTIKPEYYFYLPSKEEQIIEGTGCWHPTFPALNIHINLVVSAAMELINNQLDKAQGLAAIIRRNDRNNYLKTNQVIEIIYLKDDIE